MSRNSFVLYTDYKQHFSILTSEEQGRLIMALFDYAEQGIKPELSGATLMAFSFIKKQMDRDYMKYVAVCEKNRENIKKRWKKGDTTVYDGIRPNTSVYEPIPTDTKDTDTDTDNDTVIKTDTKQKKILKEKPAKKRYGEFQRVTLTDEEYHRLADYYGERKRDELIQDMDEWSESNGKVKASYCATAQNWARRRGWPKNTGELRPGELSDEDLTKQWDEYHKRVGI